MAVKTCWRSSAEKQKRSRTHNLLVDRKGESVSNKNYRHTTLSPFGGTKSQYYLWFGMQTCKETLVLACLNRFCLNLDTCLRSSGVVLCTILVVLRVYLDLTMKIKTDRKWTVNVECNLKITLGIADIIFRKI